MPKLSQDEREQRRKRLQEEALESVIARGQFNFRLDGEDIKRLYELAGKRQLPVSTMVREWVLERLQTEETNKYPTPPLWAQSLEQRIAHTETYLLTAILSSLELNSSKSKNYESVKNILANHIKQHSDKDTNSELSVLLSELIA